MGATGGLPPQIMQSIQQAKGMMQQLKSYQNPNIVLQQMVQQNPQLRQVYQMCQGQSPKDMYYAMAKQMGVDPEAVLKQLQS